jgi:YfiH family protein
MSIKQGLMGQEDDLHYKEIRSRETKGVLYLQFPQLLSHDGLVHAVFTRNGGVSEAPYDTLNVSYDTGDNPASVSRNLQTVKEAIGAKDLAFLNQAHGKEILVFRQDEFSALRGPADGDAMITDIPQLALMVKQADCQGVILFDPLKGVVANVHCGWRGNVLNILGSVVRRMKSDFGCRAADLAAAIGPSLGPCCSEFRDYGKVLPQDFKHFMVREAYFDLWELSRHQLLEAGLRNEHIEVSRICTRCKRDLFFSYRGEGDTGRFATVAMLEGGSFP